ncbi:MAG: hypothetical protein WA208_03130 [Thermoanaerobaculia bacterium]
MLSSFAKRTTRAIRKHRCLLLAAAIVLGMLLFPLLAGKRLSPADIFQLYAPWRTEAVAPANGLMNDAATAWFTAVPMIVRSSSSFFWNPFIGSGTAGWHSSGHGMLSPFGLLPALFLPLGFFFTGVVVLKFLAALFLAYGWLRQERLGRRGAAFGAVTVAAAGATSIWWLWPSTSATVLAPAVLWIVARLRAGKRTPVPLSALAALCILLSGFPSTILYVFYLGVAYTIAALLVAPAKVLRGLRSVVAGGVIAGAIAFPALVPFAQTIRNSAYLELRSSAASVAYPASHLLAFVKQYRLIGSGGEWIGDRRLGGNDNLPESTVYAGKLPLILALGAFVIGRRRRRPFWIAASIFILCAMFGVPVISDAIAALPGMRYTPLTRLRLLLPLAIGFLAATSIREIEIRIGRRRTAGNSRTFVMGIIACGAIAVAALDLSLFLRSFTPFIDSALGTPQQTAGLRWLRAQPRPFRVAAIGTTLWPDTAEYAGLEDIRSHFPVERAYRQLLAGVDRRSFGSNGTVLILHPESTDLLSPVLSLLNVQFMLEEPGGGTLDRALSRHVRFGSTVARMQWVETGFTGVMRVRPSADRVAAIFECSSDGNAEIEVVAGSVRSVARPAHGQSRVYVALPDPSLDALTIRIVRGRVQLRVDESGAVDVATTTFPWVPAYRGSDLTVFRNLRALDRFFALPTGDGLDRESKLTIEAVSERMHRISTDSAEPFLLGSSEKLTDELLVTIDGVAVDPVRIHELFAATPVPAGRHDIVFLRRIPPHRLVVAALGLIALLATVAPRLRSA